MALLDLANGDLCPSASRRRRRARADRRCALLSPLPRRMGGPIAIRFPTFGDGRGHSLSPCSCASVTASRARSGPSAI